MQKHLTLSRMFFWPGFLCVVLAVIAAVLFVVKTPANDFTYIYLYGGFFILGDILIFVAFLYYQRYSDYKLWVQNQLKTA